ncbi:MAG: hypothetical protein QNJ64_09915 [Crocosphaera sp.]|nr:hypothetical protein [Crocosphaera sp.]
MIKSRIIIIFLITIYWTTTVFYPPALSTDILDKKVEIVLEKGLWRSSGKDISYQDITLDLICHNKNCQSEIWGFAPEFNQAEHQGTVKVNRSRNSLFLQINLNINPDPWLLVSKKANYTIKLVKRNNQFLIGTYQGTINNKFLQGEARASIKTLYPELIRDHKPIEFQEHPRLLFRENQLPALRQKATTKIGQKILKKLQQTLEKPIRYDGYVPNAGYHGAGQCFLAVIKQNPEKAQQAWEVVNNAMNTTYPRLFELSPAVAGIAIAYDLCYDYWDMDKRTLTTNWLAQKGKLLVQGTPDRGWNPTAWSNWNARARGAAGLAGLAVLKEPKAYFSQNIDVEGFLTIAERNIIRYLETVMGDGGFGTEGDHYTTEPMILTLFPFFAAYHHVKGKNFITQESNISQVLPNYLMRIVPRDNNYLIPSYGRHRYYAGGSLFAMGLESVLPKFLPAIMWGFDNYWGENGDKTFGIKSSLDAIFLLINYPKNVSIENPDQILNKVFSDQEKGFYVFRNQWKNKNDFVASIYGRRQFLTSSWSYPDAGSFRIWGLGENWAIAGKSENKAKNENVIIEENVNPITMQPIYFESQKDGSGMVSLQSQNWLREFAVDYSKVSGVPGLFVIVDKFDDNLDSHTWVMNTKKYVEIDHNSFIIKGDKNVNLKGTFMTPQKIDLTYQADEQRIVATGKGDFWVIMTVQKGKIPKLEGVNKGFNSEVIIGERVINFKDNHINFQTK